jgi:pimeloyl-ACP methyl ester carboxylesterase
VVHFTDEEWQAFREAPVWPARVAAAPTVVRELRAGASAAAAWSGYADVRQPVLQILGSESPPMFRAGAESLGEHLADGRLVVIDRARHGAHHTQPDELLRVVTAFLDRPDD